MSNLKQASDNFDYWMKNYNHPERTDSKHLLKFLTVDGGFQYIKTYEDFCNLGKLVKENGYKVDLPPCTKIEFAEVILEADVVKQMHTPS